MWPFGKKKTYKITYNYPKYSFYNEATVYVNAHSPGEAIDKILRREQTAINVVLLEEMEGND